MTTHDVYGASKSMAEAGAVIERVTGYRLEERDSSYTGEYLHYTTDWTSEISVYDNVGGPEVPLYPEFSEYPIIVEVSSAGHADGVRTGLESAGFRLLDRFTDDSSEG